MISRTLTELHEKIKIDLIDYYWCMRSKINEDTIKTVSNSKSDDINKWSSFEYELINNIVKILDSNLADIDKYFLQLDKINQLLPYLSELNMFFNESYEEINHNESLINEESIKKIALNDFIIYISHSKLNQNMISISRKPGIFITFDFYPTRNQMNFIKAIFEETSNCSFEFDNSVLNLKYQLDEQMTIMKTVAQQLFYSHKEANLIFDIKKLENTNIKVLEVSINSLIEWKSLIKFEENTFKKLVNYLEDFSFSGCRDMLSSNTGSYLNSSLSLFRSIDNLIHLRKLSLTQCPIESLESGCFKNFRNLTELNLSKNLLKKITKTNFEGLVNLISLNLSENSITELTEFPFQYLKNLKYLDLSLNLIDDLKLDSFGYNLKNLEIIDLSNNLFKEIRKNVLKHLTNLKEICLPEYFLNYSKINLFKQIGVNKETNINLGKSLNFI